MASENKNENVMLTGQTAYFKKNGSMTNYGVVTANNQEVTNTYGPGFIEEGSTIGAAVLETSQDYVDTLNNMRTYLTEDFIDESEDYLVKANAENISTQLASRATAIQNITSHIDKYTVIPYLSVKNAGDRIDMRIPLHLEENFIIEIKSNFSAVPNTSYMIIDNGDTFQLSQNANGEIFLNGTHVSDLTHSDYRELIISQEDGILYVEVDGQRIADEIEGFEGATDIILDTRFTTQLYEIKVYGEDGVTDELVPRLDTETLKLGLHDLQNDLWYTPTSEMKLYTMYNWVNIYSGALDLEYCPGPNTGIEIKYNQWSSQSDSIYKGIIGCFSEYSVTNTLSFGLLVGNSGHIYCTRQNNSAGWVDSGVQATQTGTSNMYTITLNKQNDKMFKCTGAATWSKSLTQTATNQNTGGASMWLCGYNDLGRYIPMTYTDSSSLIPGYSNDIRVWYIKVWEGNELVRFYVPGTYIDGKQGMIDILHGKIYSNKKCSFSLNSVITNPPE